MSKFMKANPKNFGFALVALASAALASVAFAATPVLAADQAPKAEKKSEPAKPAATKRKSLPPHPLAEIPFESERASGRRDKTYVHINQDVSQVPGYRVESLPIVNGKMGEHAKLDGDLEIFFPFGRILRATTQFDKYREIAGSEGRPQENPHYRYVNMFDNVLGPVCAQGNADSGQGPVELRINRENAISLVRKTDPKVKGPDETAPSYTVVTALELRHMRDEPEADRLYQSCLGSNKRSAALEKN